MRERFETVRTRVGWRELRYAASRRKSKMSTCAEARQRLATAACRRLKKRYTCALSLRLPAFVMMPYSTTRSMASCRDVVTPITPSPASRAIYYAARTPNAVTLFDRPPYTADTRVRQHMGGVARRQRAGARRLHVQRSPVTIRLLLFNNRRQRRRC